MTTNLSIRISIQNGEHTTLSFPDFSTENWRILNNFMLYSGEAHRTRFAHELNDYKFSFNLGNGQPIKHDGKTPDDEAFYTFLHKYRPILLQSEPTSFMHVCSIIDRQVNAKLFSEWLKVVKSQFTGKINNNFFTFELDDMSLLNEPFLKAYLNGFEYHRDESHRERLGSFCNTFEADARRGLVTYQLIFKFCAVSQIRFFITNLKKQQVITPE